jgi:ABC-2 type transport system permease protein
MIWRQWLAGVRKELLLLSRDWHALALLFVMPLAFVLVMSLAMQDQFAARAGRKINVLLADADQSAASRAFAEALTKSETADVVAVDAENLAALKERMRAKRFTFAIALASGYGKALTNTKASLADHVTLLVAPDTSKQTELIFQGTVREILARERLNAVLAPLALLSSAQGNDFSLDMALTEPRTEYLYRTTSGSQSPSAVQQSVPAWLVFGAFFIVIPLSNTLIRERQQGTARRLRTLPVSQGTLLAGKLLPYFAVNQLQVIVMLLTGCFLVPALGGEALQLNGSHVALIAVGAALSLAAIGYALLIASVTSTTEQATLLGGAGNLILAAIGGIMVPKFVMPEAMQALTNISPMAWGLEGFLDVLLRDGGIRDVTRELVALSSFGVAMLALAWWAQVRRAEN